jgi:hypothetical protein
VTQLNVGRLFERTRRRAEFNRAAMSAGGPRAPPGWRPAPREPVLVQRSGAWYAGRAEAALDGGASVELPGGHVARARGSGAVVPMPPYDHAFAPGDYALLSPGTPTEPWRAVRIEEADGEHAHVVDEEDAPERVRTRQLVPLGPPR